MIDPAGWPLDELARAWREAKPFPHALIDGLLGAGGLHALRDAFVREPLAHQLGELESFLASAEPMHEPALQAVIDALAQPATLSAIAAITGKRATAVEGHAYFYQHGHYLLPHTDWRAGGRRAVAFVYYAGADGLRGGELELFDCASENGELVRTDPALALAPVADRLVLFDVSELSLHQVREVTDGVRASIAGWFLA